MHLVLAEPGHKCKKPDCTKAGNAQCSGPAFIPRATKRNRPAWKAWLKAWSFSLAEISPWLLKLHSAQFHIQISAHRTGWSPGPKAKSCFKPFCSASQIFPHLTLPQVGNTLVGAQSPGLLIQSSLWSPHSHHSSAQSPLGCPSAVDCPKPRAGLH